jgi:enolase
LPSSPAPPPAIGQACARAGARKPDDPLYTFLGGLPEGGFLGIPAKP